MKSLYSAGSNSNSGQFMACLMYSLIFVQYILCGSLMACLQFWQLFSVHVRHLIFILKVGFSVSVFLFCMYTPNEYYIVIFNKFFPK